ncbi:hypothetical protein ERO13_D12G010700v2 [Gossypium hirsutum]|uniref:Desiccation-related protein PCC13-62 n=4 Tax=Gossypium TaxID=3633 RepID=A0ABM3BAJ0_GOSHI|nr:desiccation-related protein PCC13-62-like [Gossypium hirsutum]KAB1997234.1 hypothetical protein ES319_D12G011400v1 [Gossypium barbadense]KAG4113877.1 hypothetical protein ERO13_D12G010700v2 [Gossypium hirsutum]TYG39383.1 hypothetical protein ES288_D12G012400v1 [Gossypium darwinii]TYI49071.1 hypothetical protein E1A91_D12G010900v1 [Gossypium mustelinum]
MANPSCLLYAFLLLVAFQSTMMNANTVIQPPQCRPVAASSREKIIFSVNLLLYQAEFLLHASVDAGINDISPGLVQGPDPIGATIANFSNPVRRVVEELGLATVGHLRALVQAGILDAPITRPQMDVSAEAYAGFVNVAFNVSTLTPPFNIYANTPSFVAAAKGFSAFIQQYYAGIIPSIVGNDQQQLVTQIGLSQSAGLGVLRTLLNDVINSTVQPYTFTAAELSNRTSEVVNRLGGCGVKAEGLIVPLQLGAENRTTSNVVPGDVNSLAFVRFEREILRMVFGTGNATMPGGLFPRGFFGSLYQRNRDS